MTIVKMKRLRLIAPNAVKRQLLKDLTRYGCVEVESGDKLAADPHWSDFLRRTEDESSDTSARLSELKNSLATLDRYDKEKKPLFKPRRQISEQDFYDEEIKATALSVSQKIQSLVHDVNSLFSEESRLQAKKLSFLPWASLDIPLEYQGGSTFCFFLGVCPAHITYGEIEQAAAQIDACQLALVHEDRDQIYLSVLCYKPEEEPLLDALKTKGFSKVSFKDVVGTAAENIRQIDTRIAQNAATRESLTATIADLKGKKACLEQAVDVLSLEDTQENILGSLMETRETVYMEGWVPLAAEKKVIGVLERNGCAYEFAEPAEDETPPVVLHNTKLVQPFSMVTELYALPTYKSGLDPNPFMAPFFFIFFGLMMGDFFYGLLISLFGFFMLRKARPPKEGMMYKLMQIAVLCGISTMIWGILFGSYFGNLIPTVTEMATGTAFTPKPLLFDPMADPMTLFIIALAFGFIQIFLGMGLNGYSMIKNGDVAGAIFDIGFWYLILGGAVIALVGPQKVGLICLAIGAVGVLLTGGRAKKGIFGKIIGGLSSLYGITSYLADILSYSRLLALSLATAVIAQVMNTMGSLGGSSWIGWILFAVIFVIGHLFNVLINLLGTFVHTSRLQYIEFFGKFYQPGGTPFAPLYYKTKYVEILKEEN